MDADPLAPGLTPREVARIYRVSAERVRNWITRGDLGAINTADARCGKPRYVVLQEHLREFASRRAAITETMAPRPRRLPKGMIDYLSEGQ